MFAHQNMELSSASIVLCLTETADLGNYAVNKNKIAEVAVM